MERPKNTHWLRPNHAERAPKRMMFFDSETRTLERDTGNIQTLRLWGAEIVERRKEIKNRGVMSEHMGTTQEELADLVENAVRKGCTLWVFAHNLSFDLPVTRLVQHLTRRGWKLTQHALFIDRPWCRLSKDNYRITIADSFSWLPKSLKAIGEAIGMDKPNLPKEDDSDEAWMFRCMADVRILRTAMCQLIEWWDQTKRGNWSVTGASTGWGMFRHMPTPVKVLIRPDEEDITFERSAIYGGRAEVWQHGVLPTGFYQDLDFVHAHLTICQKEKLPYYRFSEFQRLDLDSKMLSAPQLDIIAEVEVETDAPRYPMRTNRGNFYPVGRFKTVLPGPEIREAKRRGELRSIGKGIVYKVFPFMANWAHECERLMNGEGEHVTPAVQIAAKGWSRSVPGKWAAVTSREYGKREDLRMGWYLEEGAINPGHRPAWYLTIDGVQTIYLRDVDADDCFPAVLAFVQSYCRVYLSRMIEHFGEAVVQANTDGCLVDVNRLVEAVRAREYIQGDTPENPLATADEERQFAEAITAPLKLAAKKTARFGEIISPQHIILDTEKRLSGIPKGATQTDRREYRFTSWPKMGTQLRNGSEMGYVQKDRTVNLSHVPINRWKLERGKTAPVRVRLDENGENAILPPQRADTGDYGLLETEYQHPVLRDALDTYRREQDGTRYGE